MSYFTLSDSEVSVQGTHGHSLTVICFYDMPRLTDGTSIMLSLMENELKALRQKEVIQF